ncbi:hypothetical protein PR048_013346 [Dryococelus australis]|uniref:Uncharacterized protein n=1 Tax=Dryococelus australis TaxID=614101 RepID=A0ABQ9HRX1_9NEOP|nr:hypothetical protein PR048_013346 [Dryococelus australis]
MQISERTLIDKVLIKFNISDCKYFAIPMEPKVLHLGNEFLIGFLMYLMMGSRPDLSFEVSYFSKSDVTVVDAFFGAFFANDPQGRKSVTGFFIKLFANSVILKSKKQLYVSLSSIGAEYIALASDRHSAVSLWNNKSRSKMASTFETKCSEHVSVKHHSVKDLVQDKVLKSVYVDSHNQVADVLTKTLPCTKFQLCVTGLDMSKLGEV